MISEYILDTLSQGGYFVINKRILKEFGGANAIILSLLIDKFKHSQFNEFSYTGDKLEEDSGFDIRTIRKSLDFWKDKEVLLFEKRGAPCKTYYTINAQKLQEIIYSIYAYSSKYKNDYSSKYKNAPTREYKNAPTREYKNAPTREYKNAPTREYKNDISINIKTESIKTNYKNNIPPLFPQEEQEENGTSAPKQKKNEYSEDFLRFWSVYPKKAGQKPAYRAWNNCLKQKISIELLISKAKEYAEYIKAHKTEKQFIKHAQGWLNDNYFENDYMLPSTSASTQQARGGIGYGTVNGEKKTNSGYLYEILGMDQK